MIKRAPTHKVVFRRTLFLILSFARPLSSWNKTLEEAARSCLLTELEKRVDVLGPTVLRLKKPQVFLRSNGKQGADCSCGSIALYPAKVLYSENQGSDLPDKALEGTSDQRIVFKTSASWHQLPRIAKDEADGPTPNLQVVPQRILSCEEEGVTSLWTFGASSPGLSSRFGVDGIHPENAMNTENTKNAIIEEKSSPIGESLRVWRLYNSFQMSLSNHT
ncbi:hypothetical protein L596_005986 [Steinernema carpocapsae]|uniref:Uncharacterized protein n=1 Tax=Steinernema carpocapsae TaxID=34508 RepID=A0A4U8V0S1_STECR|nr:hypothetical protein L596_005986 [Steinernema carpocapsae]